MIVRTLRNHLAALQSEHDQAIDQGTELPAIWWEEYVLVSEAAEDEEYETAIEEEALGMLGE